MWGRNKEQAPKVVVPVTPPVKESKVSRFARFKQASLNLASDANTAVTQFRCARLARALRRNKALAQVARETLR